MSACANNYCQIMNRAGAIPVIQQISGVIRALIGLVVLAVAGIFGAIQFVCCGGKDTLKACEWGAIELGLGIMEIIPVVGTVGHIVLNRSFPQPSHHTGHVYNF